MFWVLKPGVRTPVYESVTKLYMHLYINLKREGNLLMNGRVVTLLIYLTIKCHKYLSGNAIYVLKVSSVVEKIMIFFSMFLSLQTYVGRSLLSFLYCQTMAL